MLVISYYYPPYSSVGAVRVSKMTRYLADHGWQATVLTVAGDDRPGGMDVEIPVEAIHRVPQLMDVTAFPRWVIGRRNVEGRRFTVRSKWMSTAVWYMGVLYRNLFCFPDPQIGWYLPAVREGLRLAETLRPHVIVSSSYPNTAHFVAARIARHTKLPWIAELRDLWTDNHNFRRMWPLRSIERALERRVLGGASALVTVSDVWASSLEQRLGKRTYVVPNGFDPCDYADLPPPQPHDAFTLVYTGTFYNRRQDPGPLIEAIASLGRADLITPNTFQLRLIGHYLEPVVARADAAGVLPFVSVEPVVPYREALARQREASALLFLDWADGVEKGWYSAKIYEYLGAGRPILSVGPHDSVAAQLLGRTRAGVVGETASEVRSVLERWIRQYQLTGALECEADTKLIKQYERQVAAATMAGILDQYARH